MKVIIVEGMDNTGKSTMIDRLIKYLTRKDGIDADKQIYVKHLVNIGILFFQKVLAHQRL